MEKLYGVSTVVGSFPYENTEENMNAAFWDQINSDVDIPSYPQLVSMIRQFLDPLTNMDTGLVKKGNLYLLEGENFKPPKEAFSLEYGKFVLDFLKNHSVIKKKITGWKACLTGPFTLAGDILIDPARVGNKNPLIFTEPRAIMDEELLFQIADMMAIIAKAYYEMGATIISMDEPSLTLIVGRRKPLFHTEDTIIEILNRAIKTIGSYSSIHVCGRISPKLRDILLSSNVKIMDHEFAKGENEGIFSKEQFDREDKTLAWGTVLSNVKYASSNNPLDFVESEDLIQKMIEKAQKTIGAENLIFKPDCGFGGLLSTFGQEMGSEIVRLKLKRLNYVLHNFYPKAKN